MVNRSKLLRYLTHTVLEAYRELGSKVPRILFVDINMSTELHVLAALPS
jgi:hypothetical protein